MSDITLPRKEVNLDALHQRLKVVFGRRFSGISGAGEQFVFHFRENETGDEAALQTELAAHDPSALTAHQAMLKQRAEAYLRLANLDVGALEMKLGSLPDGAEVVLRDILNVLRDLKALMYHGSEPTEEDASAWPKTG